MLNLTPVNVIITEDPNLSGCLIALSQHSIPPVVPVDADGNADRASLRRSLSANPGAADDLYVPDFQNPTGVPLARAAQAV